MRTLVLLASFAILVAIVSAQPSTNPCAGINVKPWKDVQSQYWTNTTDGNDFNAIPIDSYTIDDSYTASYKWPLGYRKAMIYYQNDPPFCMDVTGTRNRAVELRIETISSGARLCVRDAGSTVRVGSYKINRCFNGQVTICLPARSDTDTLNLVFFCDQSCDDGTTAFWYRVVVSDFDYAGVNEKNSAIGSIEMWCMMQGQKGDNNDRYPSELSSNELPAGVVVARYTTPSAANSVVATAVVAVTTVAAMIASYLF